MHHFITFVLCLVFVSVVQCQSSKDMLKNVRDCKRDTGCTEDIVKVMKKHEMPKTPEGNCAVACIMKKVGALEDDNSVNAETTQKILVKMHLKEDKAQTVADTCKTEVGTLADPCEAGKVFTKCVIDNRN